MMGLATCVPSGEGPASMGAAAGTAGTGADTGAGIAGTGADTGAGGSDETLGGVKSNAGTSSCSEVGIASGVLDSSYKNSSINLLNVASDSDVSTPDRSLLRAIPTAIKWPIPLELSSSITSLLISKDGKVPLTSSLRCPILFFLKRDSMSGSDMPNFLAVSIFLPYILWASNSFF